MKTIKNNIQKISCLLFILFGLLSLQAQQMQQKLEMQIDEVGNGKIDMSMSMNAQEWQQWLSTFGNNPALFKREIERGMPAFFLDDFKLEKDDINRSFVFSAKVYGVCEIDKRGKWTIDLDIENAQVTELTPHKYMMVTSPSEFGGQLQQTFIVSFPKTASKIKVDKDALGKDIFEFKMDEPSQAGFGGLLPWLGIFIAVGGISWLIANRVTVKK